MYSSHNDLTFRSKSSIDIFKSSSLDDASYPPAHPVYSTMSRGSNVRRRRRPPAPPRRSDSLVALTGDAHLRHARSQTVVIAADRFNVSFEFSPKPLPSVQPLVPQPQNSPRSNNFVKRLVATLERRQRDSGASKVVCPVADDEFYKMTYSREDRVDCYHNTVLRREEQLDVKQQLNGNKLKPDYFIPRLASKQLEDLRECDSEDDNDSYDPEDFWSSGANAASLPDLCDTSKVEPARSGARRVLKKVLSSLTSWKSAKNVAQQPGKDRTREHLHHHVTRESLLEKMRAFGRVKLPQLAERVNIKGFLDRSRVDRRRFSKPTANVDPASVEQIYFGYQKPDAVEQHRFSEYQRYLRNDEKQGLAYATRRTQHRVAPLGVTDQSSSASPAEHLVRPSKVRDLQKCLSQEIDSQASKCSGLCASVNIYDIPRAGGRGCTPEPPPPPPKRQVESYTMELRAQQPVYENLKDIVYDDKRLNDPTFTTF